jgi:hypothetical protein
LCLIAMASSVSAMQEGQTAEGIRYASGGVSETEQLAMQVRRTGFSLWVITAAIKSGAYLADVRVTVKGAHDQIVFDAPIDGPWLMLDLPIGRYEVEAQYAGQTDRQITTIHEGDHHQAVFYFKVNEIVEPR